MNYVIGLDIGTSGIKALLLSDEGKVVGGVTTEHSPVFSGNGYVEQDPAVWWDGTVAAINLLLKEHEHVRPDVAAICCSGQMHSSVFLDKNLNVIRPAILWNDVRTSAQVSAINEGCGGRANAVKYVYNPVLEGFTLPKIIWLRDNEPENFRRVSKVIMPKDYINFLLTGNVFTDYSDAAGTAALDVRNRRWSADMARAAGLSEDIWPEAVESAQIVGRLKKEAAALLGLPESVVVAAGGADNSCGGIGNGMIAPGQAVVSVGTSGTVIAFLDGIGGEVTGDIHLFNYSYPKSYYAMGCMLSAGQCVNWLKNNIIKDISFADINKLAAESGPGAGGVVFLPYLFGERCPYPDANARGVFFGLSGSTTDGDLARAVMEGVAFGLADMYKLVERQVKITQLRVTGGGAKSAVWGQIIADILGREMNILSIEEGAAFGSALIGAVSGGLFPSFEAACAKCVEISKTITPNPATAETYARIHKTFSGLYQANKALFAENNWERK
ncbi:MAG: xylulokinase [Clostridiales bacterium]|jgi:xylulokinase|nr:xylulokinase [Clostridiales bacterium]